VQIGRSLPNPAASRSSRPSSSGVESGKQQAVQDMLERGLTPGLQGPSPNQQEALQARLGRVDRGVLRWAQSQGVRLQVLQSGEELEATQALRDLSGRFEQRLRPDIVEQVHLHLQALSQQIQAEPDGQKALALRREKRRQMAEILTHNPCGATVFTPAFAPLLAPGVSSLAADPGETPSLKAMALYHGADSPEEQASFYAWMEKLNGPRLQQARQATLDERSHLLASRPEALQAWLRQAEEHPELVPLDVTLHTLVVPDAHFLSSASGRQQLLVDRSDIRSVEGWRNGDFRGQWFFLEGKAHLLVRDTAVELDTPVHELGHVIDMTLEKQEPEFYRNLQPRIEKAHYQARLQGKAISSYAMANRREYIAEGFAAYYETPEKLRKIDPELYQLVDEMVEFCCRQAGADRVLDRKLQQMWQQAMATAPQDPSELRVRFEQQLTTTPSAQALSPSAMAAALGAAQYGLLAGASAVALGLIPPAPGPEQTLADPVQQAYRQGLDTTTQRDLFELAYQVGRGLSAPR